MTERKLNIIRLASLSLLGFMFVVAISRAGVTPSTTAPNPDDVRKVVNEQAAAWNRGDLEGYMAGYWKDEGLRFYSGGDITGGWQPTLDRYRKRYQGEGKQMGRLTFSDLDVVFLANDAAMCRGRWRLDYSDGKIDQGLFTLVMRRFGNDWRVVHDHTSIASPK